MEEIQIFSALGVGGILAGMMFWFYRKDSNTWTEAWKGQTQILIQVIKEFTIAINELRVEIRENRLK